MNGSSILSRLRTGVLVTSFALSAQGAAWAQGQWEMPPPAVGVTQIVPRHVPVVNELPGRIAATRVSEVRARVSGILQERVFEQGALVEQGEVLYRIDPRLFAVRVRSAQAAVDRAKAAEANARQQLGRQTTLRDRSVGTGVDFDTAAVNLAQASADVALAEAALEEARINLDYTEVRAPISGVIGGALVTEGALVTADGGSSLALIQQVDPVYADFTQSAQQLLELRRAVSAGTLESAGPGEARVELVLDDGSVYGEAGRLLFANANVDPNTGQVTLRAEFPNASNDLLPGMYVRVRIEQATRQNAVTVPQRAVLRDAAGQAQVYVVGPGNVADLRGIVLGQPLGSEWVVESGLSGGETVIADGVQKVQPGGVVVPEAWQSASAPNGGDQPQGAE